MRLKILLFLLLPITLLSQNIDRIQINGRIIASENDVENVTVFNASSNKGTITNADGEFSIEVALNDLLNISALQFEQLKITINKDVIKTKQLTVFLVERVNKLNEVVLLPYGLSGNVAVDVKSIETFNPDLDAIYFGVNDVGAFEFSDDYKSGVENSVITTENLKYGLNVGAILGVISKNVFGRTNRNKEKSKSALKIIENNSLSDVYGQAVLSRMLDIPEEKMRSFINYVEQKSIEKQLLEEGNEVELLEFLVKKRNEFLEDKGERD